MADFEFLQNPVSKKWVILAPRRSKRTNVGDKGVAVCPFCPGQEDKEEELYRVSAKGGEQRAEGWNVRVIPNKFPFTAHHEIVIHSPDHHKNFDELAFEQVELIFQTYRERFNTHKKNGQVYIFHNRGHAAGESLPHPHTQITVIPNEVKLEIPQLDMGLYKNESIINPKSEAPNSKQFQNSNFQISKRFGHFNFGNLNLFRISDFDIRIFVLGLFRGLSRFNYEEDGDLLETEHFLIFCPKTSEWPDEVWIQPKQNGNFFGSISDHQTTDIAFIVSRIIQIYDIRHGYEFPFNFYIYPGENWYLRLIPRLKILGGFELGTKVIVNTQNPKETFAFIKEHFWEPDVEKIKHEHKAEYWKSV